jgi:hypothetical protein
MTRKSVRSSLQLLTLLFILGIVAIFSIFSVQTIADAEDSRLISFISSVPAIAMLHQVNNGNYDRVCEKIAQEAYVSSINFDYYSCSSTNQHYQVSAQLSGNQQICVTSTNPNSTFETC